MDPGEPRTGALLEIDHMYLSRNNRGILPRHRNRNRQGLVVVVDVLSGYTGAEAFRTTKQEETIPLVRKILREFAGKMKLKGSKIQSDGGVEYKSSQAEEGYRNAFT